MIDFTCTNQECRSNGILNSFLGNPKEAVCGGCSLVIIGENERPDPEVQTEESAPEAPSEE
jgi:hypothetical protein